jgi:hypothetical protein
MKSFTVATMTWLTVTEYLCHKSQSDPFLTHDLSLGLQEKSEDTEGQKTNDREHEPHEKPGLQSCTLER